MPKKRANFNQTIFYQSGELLKFVTTPKTPMIVLFINCVKFDVRIAV